MLKEAVVVLYLSSSSSSSRESESRKSQYGKLLILRLPNHGRQSVLANGSMVIENAHKLHDEPSTGSAVSNLCILAEHFFHDLITL